MIFYYIRHAEPVYQPDVLTELGEKQAYALMKRFKNNGLDEIYASTSGRAIQTAQPTADALKKEITELEFCNESHAWEGFTVKKDGHTTWLRSDPDMRRLFTDSSVRDLGHRWYEHSKLVSYKNTVLDAYDNIDEFMLSLGYEHIRYTGRYIARKPNDKKVALFAHAGYGHVFLSTVLDIPYPEFCLHFDILHTGMTVINFKEEEGFSIPEILTFSSDAHLYKEEIRYELYNGEKF